MFRSRRSRTFRRSQTSRGSPAAPTPPSAQQTDGLAVEMGSSREPAVDERQKLTGRELATLDAKICEWDARLAEQRAELQAKLAEISEYKRQQRRIPEALKRTYGRLKTRVTTTESQVAKLNSKRDDVARAADLAAFAETLDNANSVVDRMQPDLSRVGDILTTADIQQQENAETAQALHDAMSYGLEPMDDADVLLELELFEREQQDDTTTSNNNIITTTPISTSQVTTPTLELEAFNEYEETIPENKNNHSYSKNKTKRFAVLP